MSTVIGVCGLEKNVGKTSVSLFLGQAFHEITKLSSVVVDMDTFNPEIKAILEHDSTNNYNIDNIMVYAAVDGSNLESVIKSNSTPFLNSKLNVIYGTNFKGKVFSDNQISNFIKEIRSQHEFIIIDFGDKEITKTIYNNIDVLFIVCPPSEMYLRNVKQRKDLDNIKSEFILNMHNRKLGMEKFLKKNFSKEVFTTLPYSKEVQENLAKGYLDFDEAEYQRNIYDLAYKVLEKFNLEDKVSAKFLFANDVVSRLGNNKILNKIWGKSKTAKNDSERVKSINKIDNSCPMLGEILIGQGLITREQLNEALSIQMGTIEKVI